MAAGTTLGREVALKVLAAECDAGEKSEENEGQTRTNFRS
jgi:hypothetical protein